MRIDSRTTRAQGVNLLNKKVFKNIYLYVQEILTVSVGADDGVFIGEGHAGREERRVIETLITSVFFWAKS